MTVSETTIDLGNNIGGGSGIVILRYALPTILLSERQIQTTGSGELLVMEVQT